MEGIEVLDQLLIQWEGTASEDATWESLSDLQDKASLDEGRIDTNSQS